VSRTAVDTSVIIAALQEWHDDHPRCVAALDEALATPPIVLPAATLIESYSVLTRLPAPHRLRPSVARRLLTETFRDRAELAPGPEDAWSFLAGLAETAVTGGAVYDAVILHSAAAAGADRIFTLNLRHFARLAPEGLEVAEPPAV
jgi:predicted nucleic acid-binding protein